MYQEIVAGYWADVIEVKDSPKGSRLVTFSSWIGSQGLKRHLELANIPYNAAGERSVLIKPCNQLESTK